MLRQLVSELGDADVVRTLIATFLRELPTRVEVIEASPDPRRAAHTLKSAAAMLGAAPLAELCFAVEQGDAAPVDPDGRAELQRLVEGTVRELETVGPQLGAT